MSFSRTNGQNNASLINIMTNINDIQYHMNAVQLTMDVMRNDFMMWKQILM